MPPSPEAEPGDRAPRGGGVPSLFLVGCRGSGKTTVGRLLAGILGRRFIDTDSIIEEAAGRSISRLFEEDGEPAFRARESEVLAGAAQRARSGERLVVATGGGAVLSSPNVAAMREAGAVVWLRASPRVLRERIARDPASTARRPALLGSSMTGEVEAVLAAREPLYRAAAHFEVDVDSLSPDDASERIIEMAAGARSERPGEAS